MTGISVTVLTGISCDFTGIFKVFVTLTGIAKITGVMLE